VQEYAVYSASKPLTLLLLRDWRKNDFFSFREAVLIENVNTREVLTDCNDDRPDNALRQDATEFLRRQKPNQQWRMEHISDGECYIRNVHFKSLGMPAEPACASGPLRGYCGAERTREQSAMEGAQPTGLQLLGASFSERQGA